jgi:hypothetical protein
MLADGRIFLPNTSKEALRLFLAGNIEGEITTKSGRKEVGKIPSNICV